MDTLVFDIETQNFFTDPGVGRDNFEALKISGVGVYSYGRGEYFFFLESEMEDCAALFKEASLLAGFGINRYDVPVLNCYFQRLSEEPKPNLWETRRVDLLEEIEKNADCRISLSRLAEANLGVGKERKGYEAIMLYENGEMEELKKYCLKDVELTKNLYDLYRAQGYLSLPNRTTGGLVKVFFGSQPKETVKLF